MHPHDVFTSMLLLCSPSNFLLFLQIDRASSSGSNIRSVLIGMGFKPSHVDKAIRERGMLSTNILRVLLFGYS